MTIVLVTHETDIAQWARRKIVFRDGTIVEDVIPGSTRDPWVAGQARNDMVRGMQGARA